MPLEELKEGDIFDRIPMPPPQRYEKQHPMNLPDQGLQLGWTGKTAAQRVARQTPFHALEPVSSYGAPGSGNLLVQGNNLQALKALTLFAS